MKRQIRKFGFKVYSPKEVCHLETDASQKSREQVFNDNCNAIKSSRAVFAVTDGKDVGTIWEAGYAYGIGKPVVKAHGNSDAYAFKSAIKQVRQMVNSDLINKVITALPKEEASANE